MEEKRDEGRMQKKNLNETRSKKKKKKTMVVNSLVSTGDIVTVYES